MKTCIDRIGEFIRANRGLSKKEVQNNVKRMQFTSEEWTTMNNLLSRSSEKGLYNLQVVSLKRAVETATTLGDWIRIVENAGSKEYRQKAFCRIRKFDITSRGDIVMLRKSSSNILRSIGWYLDGKYGPEPV